MQYKTDSTRKINNFGMILYAFLGLFGKRDETLFLIPMKLILLLTFKYGIIQLQCHIL